MYVLKLLIILAMLFFPFGEVLRFDLGNNIAVRPFDIVIGLIAIVWIVTWISSKNAKKYDWHLFLFPIIASISLLVNLTWLKPNEFAISALYLLRWISYASVFPAISQLEESFKKKVILFFIIDGMLIVVFGYLQYFFYPTLRNLYYLGWDDHMYRLYSVFLDPNYAGPFLVLYSLFLSASLYSALYKKQLKTSIFLLLLLVVTVIAVFLTFSRGALLMFVVAAIVFLYLIKKKQILFLLIAAVALYIIVISPRFYIISINLFRTESTNARLFNYISALKIIEKTPILGVGFDSYRYAKKKFGIQEGWAPTPSHADAGVDNSFLFILATTGVVGLCAYFLFLKRLFAQFYRLFKTRKSILAGTYIASLIGLLVHALFINSLFYPEIMFYMWLLAGITVNT